MKLLDEYSEATNLGDPRLAESSQLAAGPACGAGDASGSQTWTLRRSGPRVRALEALMAAAAE